ncbi:MAG: aminotransferase class IV [Candidatus Neomarinimicrobiota bacterium]|nr:aminotransferase class IV [Candidatus Neomarinimicrobiota bacterium]
MSSHSYIKNNKNEGIFINIDGKLFPRNEAKVSVFDSGFLLGDGVWEGIRLHKGRLIFINEHLDRLFSSAKGISLNIPFSKNEIIREILKVLEKNNMKEDVHIRLIISRGEKITPYQNPNANLGPVTLVIIPEFKKTSPETYTNGISIGRVQTIRPSSNVLSTHFNTLSKLNCILGSIEANELGYDEGIMNDPYGNISTCNSTNLFFIINNEIWTSKGEYCLNGITRSKAIYICKKNDISCFEKDFNFEEIKNCDEAFVTGTFAGIIPVSRIEDKKLSSTRSNSLTNHLRDLYNKHIQDNINQA